MPKYRFKRLARDKMVVWLEARQHKVEHTRITGDEFRRALQEKVVEEALEVEQAVTRDEVVEEIADVYDILSVLCKEYAITPEEIATKQQVKLDERGAYTGLLLTGTWVPKGTKEHQYFLDRPEIECSDEE